VESADVDAEISWRAARAGTAHGIAVWFDSQLAGDAGFSNHPGAPKMIYGQGLFPFSQPVTVNAGEQIDLRLAAKSVQGDYVWRWDADFSSGDSFKQSTFYGVPLSQAQLRKAAQ